ncbi:hypothetical protein HDV00_001709 [Rhizophlyctis rosea]|nr:hypothetical protein HDV00_001709 [Rhizophlyctis rosea]
MAPSSVAFYSSDQFLTLANLIGELKGEPKEGPFYKSIKPLHDANKYTDVLSKFAKESGSLLAVNERDMESVYNLLIALIKDAPADQHAEIVTNIIQPIVDSPAERAQPKLKMLMVRSGRMVGSVEFGQCRRGDGAINGTGIKVEGGCSGKGSSAAEREDGRNLSNLYNNLEATSPLRADVYSAIVNVAANNDELDALIPELSTLSASIAQWGIGLNQQRALYLLLSQKLEENEALKPTAYEYRLKHLQTYEQADAATLKQSTDQSIAAVRDAIRLPQVLNFEDLYTLKAVQALKPSKLFDLLSVFLDQDLKAYRKFVKENKGVVEKEGLGEEGCVEKMRLLTMASLASGSVGGEVGYDVIARELEVEEGEVEVWVIDVIRAGLIDAKMNQLKKTVVVSRSTHRVFTEAQWRQLSDKLASWKNNLKDVLQVIANAKLIAAAQEGGVVEAAQ